MPIFFIAVFFLFSLSAVAQEATLEERLCAAVTYGEIAEVRHLLDSGAAVNCICKRYTSRKKLGASVPIIKHFIRDKYRSVKHEDPLVKLAVVRSDFELLKVLVSEYKANVNLPDKA